MTPPARKRNHTTKRDKSDHWEERREEIMLLAARLFAESGVDRTTVQDIMDGFKSTAAAFYYYYNDKTELLTEMLDRFMARAERRLRWLDEHPLPPSSKLRLMLAEHTTTVASDPTMAAVLFEELHTAPEPLRLEVRARIAQYTQRLITIHRAGVEAGDFSSLDSDIAVPLVLGMCNQTYRWFKPSSSMTAEDLGEIAAEMAMQAIERSATAPKEARSAPALSRVESDDAGRRPIADY